jgi:SAM-dependent methyltransferase
MRKPIRSACPFAAASFDNIATFDVLHHLERPRLFFQEAERVLRLGGRIVMVEPAITPLNGLFYRVNGLFYRAHRPRGAQPRRFGSKREWLRSNFVARHAAQT